MTYPITVIAPTFNRAAALIRCLKHLERQTWKEFEVIIVDDGSTDDTSRRLKEYQQCSSLHLRCLRQPNSGPARARNIAIDAAKAPLILMIGDDIFATPDLVDRHLELHRQRPEVNVVALGMTLWEEENQKVTPFMQLLDEGIQFAYPDLLRGVKPNGDLHFWTSNLSGKTALLRRNPFCERFPSAAFEDVELGHRLVKKENLEMVFIPEALAHHYHPTTFLQYCRRTRKAGRSARMLDEIWPDRLPPHIQKGVVSKLAYFIATARPVVFVVTYASAALSRFRQSARLLRYVLSLHLHLGYKDRRL